MSEELVCLKKRHKRAVRRLATKDMYCLIVQGDGMSGARIEDGDIVFVRVQESVNNGDIAVVSVDGKTMLSQVFHYPERQQLILRPANSKFETFLFEGEERKKVKFLGMVVACLNDFELHNLMRTA